MNMKKLIIYITLSVVATSAFAQQTKVESGADEVIVCWDNTTAPHSNNDNNPEQYYITETGSVRFTTSNETVFYLFKAAKPTGHSVAIFPGGGYKNVNVGFSVAKWLSQNGITAMVVKYRLPNGVREVPLEDAGAAVAFLRRNAERLGIDPNKIGVNGSSAGGHLAAWCSAALEGEAKPNFAVLLYPATNAEIWGCKTLWSCFDELLGHWRTQVDIENHSIQNLVNAQTPPTLILHSHDDSIAPVYGATSYYKALKQHGVKASMHIYPSGDHGWRGVKDFEYRKQWMDATLEWILSF